MNSVTNTLTQTWFAISLLCLSSSEGLEKSRLCLFKEEEWGDLSLEVEVMGWYRLWRDGLISILRRCTDINFEEALKIQPWEAGACEGEGDGVGVDDVLQIVLHKLRTNLGHVSVKESL